MNITEFLEARITEDEAVASAATPGPWVWDGMTNEDSLMAGESWVISASGMHTEGYLDVSPADRAHIARHDPARILAECKAKRAILVLAQRASETEQAYDDYEWQGTVESAEPLTGYAILYALADVYKDHPDYQEEWTA